MIVLVAWGNGCDLPMTRQLPPTQQQQQQNTTKNSRGDREKERESCCATCVALCRCRSLRVLPSSHPVVGDTNIEDEEPSASAPSASQNSTETKPDPNF